MFDIELEAEGKRLQAHKALLAAVSPYFRAMFAGGFRENKEEVVRIQGISYEGLNYVISCFYKDGPPITEENIINVLQAASLLQSTQTLKQCEEYMKAHIIESTCFLYLRLAQLYSLIHVRLKAYQYITENFLILRHSEDFKELSNNDLFEITANDLLHIYDDETQVFYAVKDWL